MIQRSSLTILIGIIFVLFIIYVIMKNRHEKARRHRETRSIFRRNRDESDT